MSPDQDFWYHLTDELLTAFSSLHIVGSLTSKLQSVNFSYYLYIYIYVCVCVCICVYVLFLLICSLTYLFTCYYLRRYLST